MDDFHQGAVEELDRLSRIASPDRPSAIPAPTIQDRSPAGPRDERGKGGVWAAVNQLPLDLEGLEVSREETMLALSRDLDPVARDAEQQQGLSGSFRSVDQGATDKERTPSSGKASRSQARPSPAAAARDDGAAALSQGQKGQVGAQLMREMGGVSVQRSGGRKAGDASGGSGERGALQTARQDSGLPTMSPEMPPVQSFPADISAISALESPVAANDSNMSATEDAE
eukprot:3821062-Rhodomonas_salina.2